jgi:uncharacterized protein YjdB
MFRYFILKKVKKYSVMKKVLLALLVIACGFNGYGQSVPCYVPTSGLVAWYPFSGNANDSSGNGNNGTNYGASLTTDRFGNANSAYSFDGTTSNISTALLPPTGNSARSISCWFKYNSLTDPCDQFNCILGYGSNTSVCSSPGNNFSLEICYYTYFVSKPEVFVDGQCTANYTSSPSDSVDNNWHFFVATYDPSFGSNFGSIKIYVDGAFKSTTAYNGSTAVNTGNLSNLLIGKGHYSCPRYFNGKIDDIGIWNRALTPCEISQLYNASCASVTAGIITGSSSVCAGGSIALTDTTAGGIWSSSNTTVATVGSTGVVTGVSGGSVTMSYTKTNACGSATATKVVTVNADLNNYIITTVAGNGTAGYSGDGGAATAAALQNPHAIAIDNSNNLYIVDNWNHRIRKVSPSGIISTFAGNGTLGYSGDGGLATSASLYYPENIAIDISGNVYISDVGNNRIRRVSSTGIITTIAGNGSAGFSGDGGAATAASLNAPKGVCIDNTGNLYISDNNNNRIRKVSSTGVITTIAGNGSAGFSGDGGVATAASLNAPTGIISDAIGNLFIADFNNNRIRKVSSTGVISTIAGNGSAGFSGDGGAATAAGLNYPTGIAIDNSNTIYIPDNINDRIRKVSSTGIISTIAGNGYTGFSGDGGAATSASLNKPQGIAVDGIGNLYFADQFNQRIRSLSSFLPSLSISGTSSICIGNSATFTDTISGGTWSSSNSAIASVGSAGVVTGVSAGTTTISYTITNTCGAASATKVITVNPLPTAISGSSSVCVGANTTLTNASAGGTWSSSSSSATVGSSSGTVAGVSAGSTTITYTLPTGCKATKAVTVNPLPTAGTITGAAAVCIGSTATVTDAATGGIWSTTNSNAVISGYGLISGLTAGLDTVVYTYINACGVATTSRTVTVNAVANAGTIAGLSSACVGNTVTLSDAAAGGIWSSSNAGVATVGTAGLVSAVAAGSTTISYSVTNSCGTVSAILPFTVNALPNAGSVTGASVVCTGSNAALTDAAAGGVWYASNSNAIVSSAGLVYGMSAGVDTITYQVTNSCGTATATRSVTVNPSPAAGTITGGSTVCAASTLALTDAVSGGTWSSSGTTIATVGSAGLVTGILAGTATISYSVTNSCGTATATQLVTVNPLPIAGTIAGSSTVCAGSNITLSDASAGGVWSASNGNANVISTGVVIGMIAGVDTISYAITNSCGTATATAVITINPLPTAGTIAGLSSVCPGANITLTDGATGGTWSATNGNASVAAGLVTGVTAGLDTVVYTVTNGCGTATATRVITINNTTTAGTITGASTVCNGGSITLSDAVAGGVWSATNGNAIITSAGVVYAMSVGVDTINYNVTGACGSATATTVITVNPLPSAGSISGSSTVCAGSTITLSDAVSGGIWTSSNSAAATVGSTGVVSGVASGSTTISYAVTNSCGTAYASLGILVNPLPVAGTITGGDTVCMGHSISLSDAVSGGVWTTVTGNATISSTGLLTGLTYGLDTVVYTVTNACGSTMATLPVMVRQPNQCNGKAVIAVDLITNVQVKPNPNKGLFTVTGTIGNSPDGLVTIEVTSMLGQSVYKKQLITQDNKLNQDVQLSNTTANGMYLLSIKSGADVKVFHIVVEQ